MNVYIGTYAKYNDGNLYGSWLRLEDFNSKEEFLKAAVSIHKDEPDPELMFQDHEDIPSSLIGESWISKNLWRLMELDKDEKEPFLIYVENVGCGLDDFDKVYEDFQESYAGNWNENWSDPRLNFAENLFDEVYEVPENIQPYIDYEKFSNELFMTDYWEVDGHVFRNL